MGTIFMNSGNSKTHDLQSFGWNKLKEKLLLYMEKNKKVKQK